MALSGLHEELHIVRQLPWKVVVFANDPVFGKCSYHGNDHLDWKIKRLENYKIGRLENYKICTYWLDVSVG
jgi:hypothetical protein